LINDKLLLKKRKLSSFTNKINSKKRQEDSVLENEKIILFKIDYSKLFELDIEERKMMLKERKIKA